MKKKKYKIKKLSIFITLLFVILIIILSLLIRSAMNTESDDESSSAKENYQRISSQTSEVESKNSSSVITSEKSESSKVESLTSSKADSSSTVSQINSSSKAPSSYQPSEVSSISTSSLNTNETNSQHEENNLSSNYTENQDDSEFDSTILPFGNLSDWNLILLNPFNGNSISEELSIKKTKFDTQYVDSRAADSYQKMYDSAKKVGITLYLRSGYRSMKTQGVNYNANVQRLLKQGLTNDEAILQTNLYYTVPGHSEHHSGLAFDIITPEYHRDIYTLNEKFAKTQAYTWLTANCAEYGFILRYPKEKYDITTINFEPWHYRYVGIEHAKYITENGICFEEYIELFKEVG